MSKAYEVRRLVIDTVNWTALVTPGDFNKVVLSRGSENDNLRLRTDPNDPKTEVEVAAGMAHEIATNPGSFNPVFPNGTTVCWLSAKTIVGSATAEFIR